MIGLKNDRLFTVRRRNINYGAIIGKITVHRYFASTEGAQTDDSVLTEALEPQPIVPPKPQRSSTTI